MATQLWPLLACLLLVIGTNVHRTEAGACKPVSCPTASGNKIFKYQQGTTYTYNVEGKTLTDLPEQQGEPVQLLLKAVAEVNFGAQCTNTLQLKNIQITGPDAKVYGDLKELEKYPVRFSFNDGVVDPEICSDDDDSNTALNIKRAIISLLQVATPNAVGTSTKTEVDFFGGCPTTFEVEARGSDTVVTKSRNLNKCLYREVMRNQVTTASYATNSELQGSPMLDANQVVEMTVKGGVLHTATSHEVYLYRPLANKDAGAKTVAHTTITFQSKSAKPPHPCKANAAHSIIFDAPHDANTDKSNKATVIAAMKSCKEKMPDAVHMMAASEFRNLVEVLRSSKKEDLLSVYREIKAGAGFADKDSARKLFMDGLFRAGTGDSVQAAVELLKSKEIPEHFTKLWYTSFGFVRHATPESVTAAASLLDDKDAPMEAYLGIGSLGGRFCSEHSCEGTGPHTNLLVKLTKPIASGCKCSSFQEENKMIAALKGIENVRGMNEITASMVRKCMTEPDVPTRVRVAALEAARSDACQPELKKTALELMANTQEDSEIRIKAYLIAVECPCGKCANAVKTLLETEPVNQVGAFIVSHLRNVRASANPDKALQKLHLSEIRATKKFPFDFRKFSQNYEMSGLLDALNIGSSVEANVIYSQKSYLPRSTSLNLTTEIFGHSINLLEIGTRAENLDRLLERWMGPKGYFKTHTFEDVLETGKSKFSHIKEKLSTRMEKTVRGKRSVPASSLEKFRQSVQVDRHDSVNLDMNVKMFGSTVCHSSYNGDGQDFSLDNMIDKFFDQLDNGINKAKSFDYDLKKHALFYENEFAYPTGLGFPLKMTVVGSAAVHMKLNGKFDLHAVVKDPKNAQFQLEALPSAAVDITGMMTMDAYAVRAGLKVVSELHTSTGFNVNVKSLDGTGVDMSFGFPVKKQEIVNVRTEVMSTVRERGSVEKDTAIAFTTKRKEFTGCFDQLSGALGVTVCSEVSVPFEGTSSKAALFPLNGPSKLSLSVQVDDIPSFRVKGHLNCKDEHRKALELLIDTPNSQTNRKVEAVFEVLNHPNVEFRAKFISPVKSALAEVIYVKTEHEESIAGRFVDDSKEYFMKLGAEVSGSPERTVYNPVFQYQLPGDQSEKLVKGKGAKGKPAKQKAGLDYNVYGSIIVEKAGNSRKYTFDSLVLTAPFVKMTVNGNAGFDESSVYTDLQIEKDKDTIFVKGKGEKHGPRHYTVNGEFKISNYPDLGVAVDWMYNRGSDQLESKLVVHHGPDLTNPRACLTAHTINKYHFNKETKDFGFDGLGTVTYPLMEVEAKAEAKLSPKSYSYAIKGAYEKYSVESHGHAKSGVKAAGDYDIEFEAKVLESYALFSTKRDVLSPHDSKFSTVVDLKPGGRYELTADTTCKMDTTHNVHKLLATLKVEGNPNPHTLDLGLEVSPAIFASHAKISCSGTDYVDLMAKVNKGSSPNGNFKVLVKDHLDGAGQFSYAGGKGSLDGHLKLVKLRRTMKAQGAMTVTGPRRQANLDLLFDENDPAKSIHFETDCNMEPESVDNKNTLTVFGNKFILNFKGDKTGSPRDGTMKGSAELTLPTNHYFSGSFNHELHAVSEEGSGAWKFEISAADSKGAPSRSVIVDIKADNCDRRQLHHDVDVSIIYKNLQGKDVKYHVASKLIPEGEKKHFEFLGQIEGSLLDMKPMVHAKVDLDKPVVKYYGKINLAADSNMEMTGMYQHGKEGLPYLYENDMVVNLPMGELKHVRVVDKMQFLPGGKDKPCELVGSSVVTYNEANTLKFEVDMKGSAENGQGKISVSLPKDELRVFKATYHIGKGPEIEREGSVTFIHGQKEVHVAMKLKVPEDKKSFHFTVTGHTPLEQTKNFGIIINSKQGETVVEGDATITVDDKKVEITSKYGRDWRNPMFEIGAVHPKGKSFVGFFFRQKGVATDHYEGEFKYEHMGEKGHWKYDCLVPSFHDFTITVDADSTRFNLNQVHVVISNKPGVKGGKTLTIVRTDAGETTVNGKLDYTLKDGQDGVLFEATGTLNVRGENRPCKFVLKKDVITSPVENGFEYSMSSTVGDRSFDTLYKQTTREVHFLVKGCSAADACGKSEYLSKITLDGFDFTDEMTMEVDTTALGFPTDVSVHRITYKKGTEFLNKVEINNHKKQIFLYKFEFDDKSASVCVITPSREMAVESSYTLKVETKKEESIKYHYEVNAWLDKVREPDNKATFIIDANYARNEDNIKANGEAKFKHPALPQDMVVKGTSSLSGRQLIMLVDVDVFAKKAQKIVIEGTLNSNPINNGYNHTSLLVIKSKGQKLDITVEEHLTLSWSALGVGSVITYNDEKGKRDVGYGIEITDSRASFFLKSPKEMLVEMNSKYGLENGYPSMEAFVSLLGCQGLVAKSHFEEGNRLIYYVHKKNTPENKVIGEFCFDVTSKIHNRLDWVHGGDKKELFNVGAVLNDKEAAPDFHVNFANFQALVDYLRNDLKVFVEHAKHVNDGLQEEVKAELNDIADGLKKSQPNLKPLVASYQKQLQTLKSEVTSEQAIQDMSDTLKKFITSTTEAFGVAMEMFAKIADKMLDLFEEFSNTMIGSMKRFMPQATESFNKIYNAALDIFNALATQALNRFQELIEFCKKYEGEFQEIGTSITEMGRSVFQATAKVVDQFVKEAKDFLHVIVDQIRGLPMFSMLQERLDEMKEQLKNYIPMDQVYSTLHEATKALKDTLPTQELRDFVDYLSHYFEKLLKKDKIDYAAENKKIYQKGIAALKSVVVLIRAELGDKDAAVGAAVGVSLPISLKSLYKIPVAAAFHFSPINFLRSGDLPSLREVLTTYLPKSLDPLDWFVPFKAYGMVIDTTNFVTFDNRYFGFKGSCSYILAQDVTDGNFTVVLNLEKNGKFKSIALSDNQDVVEYTAQKTVLLNGKAGEFPMKTGNLKVWRRYHSIVMESSAGVAIQIFMDYSVTVVGLSGFYHGRVRGLLGDANYEPYDDYRLPSGQICTDTAELANAYSVSDGCAPGVAVQPKQKQEALCTSFFSSESSMRHAFPLLSPELYREACNNFVATTSNKKQEYACRVAAAYVLEARKRGGFLVNIPSVCASCQGAGKPFNVGDVMTVKVPSQKADIVFVVEQDTRNADIYKDLVAPLVPGLTADLKSKGITDISFSLMGFGHPKHSNPEFHTSSGKIGFDGKATLEFGDAEPNHKNWGPSPADKIGYIRHKFLVESGLMPLTEAVAELVYYPWRIGASKAIVLVTAEQCETGLAFQQLRQVIVAKAAQVLGINVHVVSPMDGFNIVGSKDAKAQKNVVGFDSEAVYTFADGKKKTMEGCGNTDLRSEIEYKKDSCIDVAQATNGAAYNAANFLEAKGNQRKQFVQMMVNKMSQGLTTEVTEECTCKLDRGLFAETSCKVTARKESEKLSSQTETTKSKTKGVKKPKN